MNDDTRQAAAPVKEGDILAGKYRVERVLGVGGMGVVARARHVDLDQLVAIKWMHAEVAGQQELVERFLREGKAAARLRSEHVTRVLDVSRFEGGAPYMVMEYLEGGDLGQTIAQRGALPVQEAVEYVLQALEAVAEAHAKGIVHRDLKPSNLFLTTRPDGSPLVKVLDFGISKMASEGSSKTMTATSTMLGSPAYMSPEQIRSAKHVDRRTDIWAMGVILYELLTGKIPFDADSLPGLVASISMDPPTPLRERRADIDPRLEAVVLKCLEKDVTRRFQHVGELAEALLPYARPGSKELVERIIGVLGEKRESGDGSSPATATRTTGQTKAIGETHSTFGVTVPEKRMGRTALVGILAATVLLVAGAGVWFLTRTPQHESMEATKQTAAASVTAKQASGASSESEKDASSQPTSVDAGTDARPPADSGADVNEKEDSGRHAAQPATAAKPIKRTTKPNRTYAPASRPKKNVLGAHKSTTSNTSKTKPKPTSTGGGIDLSERK